MSLRRIPVNLGDLEIGKLYQFRTRRGGGLGAVYLDFEGIFVGFEDRGFGNQYYFHLSNGKGIMGFPLQRDNRGRGNVLLPQTLYLIPPNLPPPPSPDDRNIPSLATLAHRQLSTGDMHDLNTNYEMPHQPKKLYGPNELEGGLKSKRRRTKKTKTKRRPSTKTKRRSHRK